MMTGAVGCTLLVASAYEAVFFNSLCLCPLKIQPLTAVAAVKVSCIFICLLYTSDAADD